MIVLDIALVALGVGFALGMVRVILGPSVADRAVATDLCLFTVVAAVALTVLRTGAEQFEDVVLIATLLGFLATIALAALVGREGE
ncbi:monovalent cation/H+ antiporter complex subunit F [Nitriliruptor alkaliphilus]|uniref:monovalent cation/H+ antiporter complex subunit F n=1 Tax=Nitriliruptor alkaliphilus TaxID=427918 RepID=UPI000697C56A|nr:monovalent cation/H+ antiporter complex subunit F [Nitriliruptor alkaliphilus]